ncbi:hypothetical protein HDU97_000293 [Phlyctochytrium planicorne]|nr:hypothetical protein HDU97_000293 [Phlyctochytrium planicorne]
MSHSHSHSCGHEHHEHGGHDHHDHDHDGPDRGNEFTLYQHIDIENVVGLNESIPGSAQKVFKPYDKRYEAEPFVESDADEQLIIKIPFTGSVKLKSIAVKGAVGDSNPSKLQAFINRDDVDFDTVEDVTPEQEWELVRDPGRDIPEYPTKIAKFSNVRNLILYFPSNFGSDVTRISYIGLKGEWTEIKKDPIITVYELAANPADHQKLKGSAFQGMAPESFH